MLLHHSIITNFFCSVYFYRILHRVELNEYMLGCEWVVGQYRYVANIFEWGGSYYVCVYADNVNSAVGRAEQ